MKHELTLMKRVDGKKIRATIEVEIRTEQQERQTVDHRTINHYQELAISGTISGGGYGSGGQCIDTIAEAFADDVNVQAIHEVWKRHHLNGMKAGCIHMDTQGKTQEECLKMGCQETGYKYGRQWLVEELPAGAILKLKKAISALEGPRVPTHMEDFATEHGIKIESCTRVDETKEAIEYHLKLSKGGATFTVGSFKMGKAIKRKPGINDILSCLVMDCRCPDTFEEFCSEWGYGEDSREANRAFEAIRKQRAGVKEFLGKAFDGFLELETE